MPQAPAVGSILPGLSRPSGLKASRRRIITSRSSSVNMLVHEVDLLDADAVLAGDAAAAGEALVEDLVAGRQHALDLRPASRSSNSRIGWMLPSPAWKTLTIRMSYFAPISRDPLQDVRQLRARHDAVLRAVAGAQPADRAERLLAALPQQQPLLGVGRPGGLRGRRACWQISTIRSRCSSRPASRPSTSMSRTASASSGKPK